MNPNFGDSVRKSLYFLLFLLSTPLIFSQTTFFVDGYVRDKRSGARLSDVNVYIPGTRIGASSDITGYFLLSISASNIDEATFVLNTNIIANKSGFKRFNAPVTFKVG